MDAILQALVNGLTKADNIGLMVSVLFNVALGWAHIRFRAEDRLDRQQMTQALTDVVEALHNVKNVLSAAIGKPIV
jgi:hypothetical protein